ncbi:MAG TPA: hypothetical protein VL588_06150 [Bdellovibrionota bacterium]|jgi:ferredoxin|nr:hypothetical protein [Bdellovibrionota bacterium]
MAIRFKTPRGIVETPCLRGLNLLGHAQVEELDIGSDCGGHGICAGDQIQLPMEGRVHFSPPTAEELRHLSARKIAAGWRLACQCYPAADDLDLEVQAPRSRPKKA